MTPFVGNSKLVRLAAVDVGTNSIHLIIADVDVGRGKFRILDREKEVTRLGSGTSGMKYLSEKAMKRGISAIKRFKALADAAGASVRAVGTSAVREASNRNDFIRRTRKETGVSIEVASGSEEARLIYLGVLQALPVFRKKVLLIDIGGGSTEFLVGRERDILYVNSLEMGALRLTHRFFGSGPAKRKEIDTCRKAVKGMLSPLVRDMKHHPCDVFIGTSGTIMSIATAIGRLRGDRDFQLNGFSITSPELKLIVEKILEAGSRRALLSIKGLDTRRVDIIVAGAIILDEIFKALHIKKMEVSEYALREGIILDTVEKQHREVGLRLHEIRYHSVLQLAENFHYEKQHAHHVAELALTLFDQTKQLHRLGEQEREYLEAAALLHEIGLSLSHSQHHRHSYYLIRNSELMGYTEDEKDVIANIARYHRKGHPKFRHENFDGLSAQERKVARALAAILRVADGLDRSHSSKVGNIICKRRGSNLVCDLTGTRGNLDLELWGVELKKQLFEEVFNVQLKFRVH